MAIQNNRDRSIKSSNISSVHPDRCRNSYLMTHLHFLCCDPGLNVYGAKTLKKTNFPFCRFYHFFTSERQKSTRWQVMSTIREMIVHEKVQKLRDRAVKLRFFSLFFVLCLYKRQSDCLCRTTVNANFSSVIHLTSTLYSTRLFEQESSFCNFSK